MSRELDSVTGAVVGMGRLEISATIRNLSELHQLCGLLEAEVLEFAQGFDAELSVQIRLAPAANAQHDEPLPSEAARSDVKAPRAAVRRTQPVTGRLTFTQNR